MLLVSYIQQYLNTSITFLTNQVWKLLIALSKVQNTGLLRYNKNKSIPKYWTLFYKFIHFIVHDNVMLSSNMAASIATEINILSFMQVSFYIIVRNSFSMNFSIRSSSAWRLRARAHVARDYPGYPGQSVQSDGHVGGQHDVSENSLLLAVIYGNTTTMACCINCNIYY